MSNLPKLASAPRVEQTGKRAGRLCSKDLALNANKRSDMILQHKLSSLVNEKDHCMKVYNLNRFDESESRSSYKFNVSYNFDLFIYLLC